MSEDKDGILLVDLLVPGLQVHLLRMMMMVMRIMMVVPPFLY